MKVKISELKNLAVKILSVKYYSQEQAEQIADVLMYAELTGKNTQGVIKLLGTEPMQNVEPNGDIKVIKETKLSALIDGNGNAAPLGCRYANELAIQKCKDNGLSIVGIHNIYSSSGVIGYYVNEITKHDLIGIAFAGSPGGVVPFGSLDPLFGTNPFAFGFPTNNDPVIFDMATSAITWYGLVRAKALGQPLPKDVATDKDGQPTTDPDKAMEGGILSFDRSYKGSGLGMIVEILTGPLAGGTFCTPDGKGDWSNLFIAINPDLLVGKEQFKKVCSELVERVKSSRIDPKMGRIRIFGEEGLRFKKEQEQSNEVDVDGEMYNQLVRLS